MVSTSIKERHTTLASADACINPATFIFHWNVRKAAKKVVRAGVVGWIQSKKAKG